MACKRLLLVIGVVAAACATASGAPPTQPARIQAGVVVTGFVPCNNGTSMRTGSAPGFPGRDGVRYRGTYVCMHAGAVVELLCTGDGAAGALAANATTDGKGWFRMAVNTTVAPSSVASSCVLVVDTPLAACNATLPATGALRSGLRMLVSMVFFPRGFSYVATGDVGR